MSLIDYLQAKYFRTGPRTHLHVTTLRGDEGVTLSWTFMFQDLGSFHSLSNASVLTLDDEHIIVDGVHCSTANQVERLVFGTRYEDYVRALYAEEGIVTP